MLNLQKLYRTKFTSSSTIYQPATLSRRYVTRCPHLEFASFKQVEEFGDVVDREYYGWVSQYLVMKRVSIEPNFHVLYMNFLDALNDKQMFVSVLKETHRNIKV